MFALAGVKPRTTARTILSWRVRPATRPKQTPRSSRFWWCAGRAVCSCFITATISPSLSKSWPVRHRSGPCWQRAP